MIDILFCATDAGGFNNILLLAQKADEYSISFKIISFDRYLSTSNLPPATRIIVDNPVDKEKIVEILAEFSPAKIICGTTAYYNYERELIYRARQNNIFSIAVLDEWYNYRIRFTNETDELIYLPDKIIVTDSLSYSNCIAENLPPENLIRLGSPYLTNIVQTVKNNRLEYPSELLNYKNKTLVTFISEEIEKDFHDDFNEARLGPYKGYNEFMVLNDIIDVMKNMTGDFVIIEKIHPSSDRNDVITFVNNNLLAISLSDINLHALLMHSNLVIGMKSIAVLESVLLGVPACSYQPNLLGENQCTAVKLGVAPMFRSKEELRRWVNKILSGALSANPVKDYEFINDKIYDQIFNMKNHV